MPCQGPCEVVIGLFAFWFDERGSLTVCKTPAPDRRRFPVRSSLAGPAWKESGVFGERLRDETPGLLDETQRDRAYRASPSVLRPVCEEATFRLLGFTAILSLRRSLRFFEVLLPHASARAFSTDLLSAACRMTVVEPLRPQPPFTGVNTLGFDMTSASCCSMVRRTIPLSFQRVANILPPTRKSGWSW